MTYVAVCVAVKWIYIVFVAQVSMCGDYRMDAIVKFCVAYIFFDYK